MNGAHDMGGMDGFGPIVIEANEPLFHAAWERRAFALTLAMGRPGGWNIDMSRFARENRAPIDYLSKSYYQLWLAGLEVLMAERGLVTADEIAAGRPLHPRRDVQVLTAADVTPMLARGAPTERDAAAPARFGVGDRVRAKDLHPRTHIRLPRYVRGRIGTIELVHGAHVFPDSHAHGGGEQPQWLYTVAFEARELWGDDADPTSRVSVDAWDSYLERA
ncbi:nitrile hydratase subunit beta [Rhodopseudomonas palustris]|uniref:nitrile hydratase subunit beta n=1 Tax=Rhodopseudomonas palustris TaxID=1076 RepID=UPI000E5A9747|nr:nitrile hydratase subunit beta [Rhodopseudomonas palustris]QLH71864.1 nitrile hydratase subunit beta [Rhodopseudomonas palustris]RIA01073.1 nitrile hydratase subunit beta [Rhodopseudomonas palustris]